MAVYFLYFDHRLIGGLLNSRCSTLHGYLHRLIDAGRIGKNPAGYGKHTSPGRWLRGIHPIQNKGISPCRRIQIRHHIQFVG